MLERSAHEANAQERSISGIDKSKYSYRSRSIPPRHLTRNYSAPPNISHKRDEKLPASQLGSSILFMFALRDPKLWSFVYPAANQITRLDKWDAERIMIARIHHPN